MKSMKSMILHLYSHARAPFVNGEQSDYGFGSVCG